MHIPDDRYLPDWIRDRDGEAAAPIALPERDEDGNPWKVDRAPHGYTLHTGTSYGRPYCLEWLPGPYTPDQGRFFAEPGSDWQPGQDGQAEPEGGA